MHSSDGKQGAVHVLWYSRERMAKTDMEEIKLLNKVVIFVFFAYKKYSRSFIKLWLMNHYISWPWT